MRTIYALILATFDEDWPRLDSTLLVTPHLVQAYNQAKIEGIAFAATKASTF